MGHVTAMHALWNGRATRVTCWVVVWDAASAADPATTVVPPGVPVRVLLDGTARLPEQAFLRCRDLKVAQVRSGTEAFRQVRAWLEELRNATP